MSTIIIFYLLLAAQSEFDIRFPPSGLDYAVQEVEIFAFLQKIEKRIFEQEWTITMFDMFLNVFLDMLEVFIFKQTFSWSRRKLTKIKNLNILSENK